MRRTDQLGSLIYETQSRQTHLLIHLRASYITFYRSLFNYGGCFTALNYKSAYNESSAWGFYTNALSVTIMFIATILL